MAGRSSHPPYEIRTERLVLRCWEPRDAPALDIAVRASLDHLRAWMPWAHAEPTTLDERVALLRRFRGAFDLGQDFVYGLFELDGETVVGGSGLHTRLDDDALEIGYWIRADATGRGLATEATAALTRVALELVGVGRVEIHVDPANAASIAIPRRLGFTEEGTLRRRLDPQPGAERRDAVVFTMFADELSRSAAATVAFEAFDALGRPVPG